MNDVQPPVIVAGMHRSGTSLVVKLLEGLGVFMGHSRDPNEEAVLFLHLNEWLLRQSGSRWDRPGGIRDLVADPKLRDAAGEYLRDALRGLRLRSFTGWIPALRDGLRDVKGPWGWKDPRNTFTLPIWLDLFPDARVIHVRRHGVDVAASLRRRTDRAVAERLEAYRRHGISTLHRRGGFADSPRTRTLEGGFSLWEEYLEEGSAHADRLGEKWLEVRFEELVTDPGDGLQQMAGFLEFPHPPHRGGEGPEVRSDRAWKYRSDPELREFARSVGERLERWGYRP